MDVGYERFLGPEIFFHPEVSYFWITHELTPFLQQAETNRDKQEVTITASVLIKSPLQAMYNFIYNVMTVFSFSFRTLTFPRRSLKQSTKLLSTALLMSEGDCTR